IITELSNLGYTIKAYDPHVVESFDRRVDTLDEALAESDLVILVTDHKEFQSLSAQYLKKLVRQPLILDTRNMLPKEKFLDEGIRICTLGDGQWSRDSAAREAAAAVETNDQTN
ncbi:MAG: hypothetical protein GX316_02050, partial [Firmicutes bacterium]|nr:hypothetical protein [Bacillota bacterium]